METATIGRVLTEATIENLDDLLEVRKGQRDPDKVRRVTVDNALVDTGATSLSLPTRLIRELGLQKRYERRAISSSGAITVNVYEAVRLTIQGRYVTVDPSEVPDDVPVLIGQIPLEFTDLVVDPRNRRLIGNPEHGGEHVLEML